MEQSVPNNVIQLNPPQSGFMIDLRTIASTLKGQGLDDDALKETLKATVKSTGHAIDAKTSTKIDDIIDELNGNILPFSYYTDAKGNKKIVQSVDNYVIAITQDPELEGKIYYDQLYLGLKYTGSLPWHEAGNEHGYWTDNDDAELYRYLERKYSLGHNQNFEKALKCLNMETAKNPAKEYLESLIWDHKDHITTLLQDYLGAYDRPEWKDKHIYQKMLKLWMIECLHRLYDPGCKCDEILVLAGEQGLGKSTFFRRLAHNPDWYNDNLTNISGTDGLQCIRGIWIACMDELLADKKAKDTEAMKSFATAQTDYYRESYGHRAIPHPRQCMLAATTNDREFLTDYTGNRRWLVIQCDMKKATKSLFQGCDIEDFEQAWAQVMYEYKNEHPSHYIEKDLRPYTEQLQEEAMVQDSWVGEIEAYLETKLNEVSVVDMRVCAKALYMEAIGIEKDPSRGDVKRITQIMDYKIKHWVRNPNRQVCRSFGLQTCWEPDQDILDIIDKESKSDAKPDDEPDAESIPF